MHFRTLKKSAQDISINEPIETDKDGNDLSLLDVIADDYNLHEQIDLKIEFVDERLSSLMAEEILKQTERDWKKRKEKLDAVAASIILQDYLDGAC